MPYRIFTAGQLRELAGPNSEAQLFHAASERFWVNLVHKDHSDALVAEMHDDEADIYLVVAGEADLHLGGTLVDPHSPRPGQHRGTGLHAAACHHITTGDLIIIPAGTPHMLDVRESTLVYAVIKEAE